jgi:glutamine synthetase
VLRSPARVGFISELGILNGDEIHARHEVFVEKYVKEIHLEATVLSEVATTQIAPAVQAHIARVGAAVSAASQSGLKSKRLESELKVLVERYDTLGRAIADLDEVRHSVGHDAVAVADKLRAALAVVRAETDALEQVVADDLWPLPKYREMLLCGV